MIPLPLYAYEAMEAVYGPALTRMFYHPVSAMNRSVR